MSDTQPDRRDAFALIDPGVRTLLRLTGIVFPAILIGVLVAFQARYGNTWTTQGIIGASTLLVTAAVLVTSSILLGRRRDLAGLTCFAVGLDILAIAFVAVSPASHAAVAALPLLGAVAMLGFPGRKVLLATLIISWGLAVAIFVWGQTQTQAATFMPAGPSRVAHSITFAALAAMLLAIVYSFRERLTRATGDLRADVARRQAVEETLRRNIAELEEARTRQRRLLGRLVSAEEDERQRIASGLHDVPVQKIAAALLRLQSGGNGDGPGATQEAERLMTESIADMRHMMFELRPRSLDEHGLAAAANELVDSFGDTLPDTNVHSSLAVEPPDDTRTIAFRIVAEALTNVSKHAHATHAEVVLEDRDGGVLLAISDDGVGMDPEVMEEGRAGHLGLPTMIERAEIAGGRLRISRRGGWTRVEAWLPRMAPASSKQ